METTIQLPVSLDREDDGRWIAEVESVPGALAYGATREEAYWNVVHLSLRVLADQLAHGEQPPAIEREALQRMFPALA